MKNRKPVRTLSGVTPLAVMIKHRDCPHGTCVYCPNVGVPVSYVEKSPVVLRASSVNYDALEQVKGFDESIGIDGIILSKADIDEKGGTALSVGYVTKKPILYLGVGQGYDDIEPFDKKKFIEKLGL